jgi:hypothetical protein
VLEKIKRTALLLPPFKYQQGGECKITRLSMSSLPPSPPPLQGKASKEDAYTCTAPGKK